MSDTMVSDKTAVRPNVIPGVLKTIVLSTAYSVSFSGLVSQSLDSIRRLRRHLRRGMTLPAAEDFLRTQMIRMNGETEFLIASHMPDARIAKVSHGIISAGLDRYWIGDPQIADEIYWMMEDGRTGRGGEYCSEEEMRFRSAFEELVQEKYRGAVGGVAFNCLASRDAKFVIIGALTEFSVPLLPESHSLFFSPHKGTGSGYPIRVQQS